MRLHWLFLFLLATVGAGGFAVEALRIHATQPAFERVSFAGWALGQWLAGSGLSAEWAQATFAYLWVFHAGTALVLVAYVPYSKAWHMLAAWYTLAIKPEDGKRTLPQPIPSESGGYARFEDLTRGELAALDACSRCGRCHVACPAANAGFPLSPRDLILALRSSAEETLARRPRPATAAANSDNSPLLAGPVVPQPWLWSCTTCLSCDEVCPLAVPHVSLIVQMRRYLVSQGELDSRMQDALANLTRYGNSFGQSARTRAKWTQELPFKIKDARKERVENLWLVGDYASYDPRVQAVTRAAARVFQQAGLDFGILYEGEQNAGNDTRRMGEEGLFEMLRDKNLKTLGKAQFETVVTTDPHTYHVLKNEYAGPNGNGAGNGSASRVLHCTELLDLLLRQGKLPLRRTLKTAVTYHDPCYLGRYNGVYDPPRHLLDELGVSLVEMPRNRADSYCCGAGGGRIWMEDVPGLTERPAESRVREAARLHGVSTLVVSCPKDLVMFQDALKTTELEGTLKIRDAMELVEEAIGVSDRSESHDAVQAQR
jgi:Fe-S oxidoreductase